MALIGRLFVVAFGFLMACFVAGIIVVGAVLYPEISDFGGQIDQSAIDIVLGFGFIFISGFALLPALIVVLITEAFFIRSVLAYAIGGAIVGAACYLGLIPFDPTTLPVFGHYLALGIWPIIMGITMWVQMKLNPAPPDPTQKIIFDWMPLIFTFMLASFPAGLVIYWAWNNSLSILQQWIIMRRMGVKVT